MQSRRAGEGGLLKPDPNRAPRQKTTPTDNRPQHDYGCFGPLFSTRTHPWGKRYDWDLPQSHHKAAGEGHQTGVGTGDCRSGVRVLGSPTPQISNPEKTFEDVSENEEVSFPGAGSRPHNLPNSPHAAEVGPPQRRGQASEKRDTPGGAGGNVAAPKTPLPRAPALAARTYPTPPTRDASVRMTQTHCNTQPVSKVPVQAAQMACAPGRETGVRDADGGYCGEGCDWEAPLSKCSTFDKRERWSLEFFPVFKLVI